MPFTMTLQPSAASWSSASKRTRLLIAALTNLVPSAVRKSTVRCWTTKLTGKISGWLSTLVTRRPNATLASRSQLSLAERMVTGSTVADILALTDLGDCSRVCSLT